MRHSQSADSAQPPELQGLVARINNTLQMHSDKDWNYSRISLQNRALDDIEGPYALWPNLVDISTKQGQLDFKASAQEVAWGERHSNELGILEIISLRVNKALLETASGEVWASRRPVVHVKKKEQLAQQGITHALWYRVSEVGGEDFDNR